MTLSRFALAAQRLAPWFRAAAWLCVGLIVLLSLAPASERPHTGLPGKGEHMIAYAGTGVLAAWGYQLFGQRRAFWIGVATLSFVLEYLQKFLPGRSPNILDAIASASGLSLGMALGALLMSCIERRAAQSGKDRSPRARGDR